MTTLRAGQTWNIPRLMSDLDVFSTLIGTYPVDPERPSTPAMSVHLYRLAAGQADQQAPHAEQELYYVLSGARTLVLNDGAADEKRIDVAGGDLVYVPARTAHRFDGQGEIVTLVFFAPNFSGPA